MEQTGNIPRHQIESDPGRLALLNSWHVEARQKHTVKQFDSVADFKSHLLQHIRSHLVSTFPRDCFIDGGTSRSMVKYFQMTDLAKPFISTRPHAKSIDILAVSALTPFHTFSHSVEEYLKRGTKIRLIILQECGQAVQLVETLGGRKGVNQSLKATKERVRRIKESADKNKAPGTLDLRELDWVFSATLFILDGSGPDPICWVGTYTPDFATPSNKKWFAELSNNSSADALKFYAEQFNQLWQRACPVS